MKLYYLGSLLLFAFLVSSNSFAQSNAENTDAEGYHAFSEVMPEPVEGLPAVMKKVKYPTMAEKAGKEGKVIVQAKVNEKGVVEDVKVIKGLGFGCDEAVIDVLKKTKFKPGLIGNVPVKVKVSLSFNFKL